VTLNVHTVSMKLTQHTAVVRVTKIVPLVIFYLETVPAARIWQQWRFYSSLILSAYWHVQPVTGKTPQYKTTIIAHSVTRHAQSAPDRLTWTVRPVKMCPSLTSTQVFPP